MTPPYHRISVRTLATAVVLMMLVVRHPADAEVVTKIRKEPPASLLFPFSKGDSASKTDEYIWNGDNLDYVADQRMWKLDARMMAGFWYDDNLFLDDGVSKQPVGDAYFSLNPSFDLNFGPNAFGLAASIYYSAEMLWYVKGETDDATNHHLSLTLSWTGAKARAFLSAAYASIHGPDVDVGDRLEKDTASISAGFSYILGAKTTLGVAVGTTILDYTGGFFNSSGYSASAYVDYQFSPKTAIGIGVGYGYNEIDGGSEYNNYDLNLRATWAATSRMTIAGTGGLQLNDTEYSQDYTPVLAIDLDYDLLGDGKTSAKVSIYRDFHPAALFGNQAYWSTGAALDVSHAMTDRTRLGISLGYEFADYEVLSGDLPPGATREDNYYYIRPHFTYAFSERISMSLFYQFSNNDSEGYGAASFERNWIGITLNSAL